MIIRQKWAWPLNCLLHTAGKNDRQANLIMSINSTNNYHHTSPDKHQTCATLATFPPLTMYIAIASTAARSRALRSINVYIFMIKITRARKLRGNSIESPRSFAQRARAVHAYGIYLPSFRRLELSWHIFRAKLNKNKKTDIDPPIATLI